MESWEDLESSQSRLECEPSLTGWGLNTWLPAAVTIWECSGTFGWWTFSLQQTLRLTVWSQFQSALHFLTLGSLL